MKKHFKNFKYITIFISYFFVNYLTSALLFTKYPFLSILFEIIYFIVLVFIFRKTLHKEWHVFTSKIDENVSTAIWYWVFGISIMTITNVIISNFLPIVETNNEDSVRTLINYLPITMMFSVIITAPLIEETIFRLNLRFLFKNKWVYVIISGLIFGSMHVIYNMSSWYDLALIIPYGSMGFFLALAYYKTKTIYTSYLMHIFHNLVTFLLLMLAF